MVFYEELIENSTTI